MSHFPTDGLPWGPDAYEQPRILGDAPKPIFLSAGEEARLCDELIERHREMLAREGNSLHKRFRRWWRHKRMSRVQRDWSFP